MSEGTRTPQSRDEQRIVWRRLKETLRPQATASQVIVGLLCLLLGVSIAAQMGRNDESLEGATQQDRKSTRLNSSHSGQSRMPSSA